MEKTKISKIVIICIVISLISTSFIFSADATVQYTGVNVVSVKQATKEEQFLKVQKDLDMLHMIKKAMDILLQNGVFHR